MTKEWHLYQMILRITDEDWMGLMDELAIYHGRRWIEEESKRVLEEMTP